MRRIELDRDRVTVRRAVHGMRMAINIRISEFLGVALRTIDGAPTLILKHRDPSLSVPLTVADNDVASDWRTWSEALALPQICDRTVPSTGEPTPRRRRRNAIKRRRPSILMRRRIGRPLAEMNVHRDEREIIARS